MSKLGCCLLPSVRLFLCLLLCILSLNLTGKLFDEISLVVEALTFVFAETFMTEHAAVI